MTENVSSARKRSVTIFGAGVAGLTVAHELAERGFEVEVIDPDIREEIHSFTLDRGIGGMARSQCGCWLASLAPEVTMAGAPLHFDTGTDFLLNDVLVFDEPSKLPADPLYAEQLVDRVAELLRRLVGPTNDMSRASELTIAAPDSRLGTREPGDPASDYRVEWMKKQLVAKLGGLAGAVDHLEVEHPIATSLQVPGHAAPRNTWLFFHLPALRIFPAEHGFRFFPSFYRHIFDSLRRIPLHHPRPHETTIPTVRENLVPSVGLGFARAGAKKSFLVPRREIKSLEVARGYLTLILEELGYELGDVKRFSIKLLTYMTSSTKRRAGEYENLSWGRFVEQHKYSKVSREHIEYGPAMSAALRGSLSDARTQGSISVQLFMDQLRTDGRPDCTLNGPTNSAWFNHWHDYLSSQRVRFRRGTLVGFGEVAGEVRPLAYRTVEYDANGEVVRHSEKEMMTTGEYFVLALSLPAATKISEKFLEVAKDKLPADNDFERTIAFAGDLDTDLVRPAPEGPLQHLSGIQFYFDAPLDFWRGHTQYLDAQWGLTSISQLQFWVRARDSSDGYRGVLSVDIGIWDRKYKGKCAWECTPDEIAVYAWEQIHDHHDGAFRARYGAERPLPKPIAYAVDANVIFDPTPKKDLSPFLVNRVGAYPKRPGRLIDDARRATPPGKKPPTSKQMSFYDVYLDRYVLVGTFMKTYTRLTSMEGANESARHGVNAILTHGKVLCEQSEIWDPEDNEIPDLQWLRDLDERRFEEGKPHLLETLAAFDPFENNLDLFAGAFDTIPFGGRS